MNPACESATDDCRVLLEHGLELICHLPDDEYVRPVEGEARSSPGAHTRHIIDYFDCLFSGIETGAIDYATRARRVEVEESRAVGIEEITRCLAALEPLASLDGRSPVEVRTDVAEAWTGSTLARELRFVAGHTVHHYALIRRALAHRGIATPEGYGVSSSTLAYRRRTGLTN